MPRLPAEMTAACIRRTGGWDEIEVCRLPLPVCGRREVLVQVEALAVNHVDRFVRSGSFPTALPWPFIIGRDLAGRVVAVGEGVDDFSLGDRVWCNSLGHDGRQGSFSEYALAPAERVYSVPDGVDPADAVSVVHSGAAAWLGLFREGRVHDGTCIFIAGAAGGVGSAAVEMAHAAGARVLASAAPGDAEWVASLGAAEVLDYRDPGRWHKLAAAAPEGLDLYWDQSGRHEYDQVLPLLARGGRIIISAGLDARPELPVGQLYTRDASLRGFALSGAPVQDLADAAASINQHLAAGRLRGRIARRLPLSQAAQAHRLLEKTGPDRVRGKLIVQP